MIKLVVGAAVGAALGGWIGYATKCAGGGCPMMGNPVGGVIFGAIIGTLLASSFGNKGPAFTPSKNVVEIASSEQFETLLKSQHVVMADFYADWCGPCRNLKPTIHELADAYAGRVTVAAVNVDANGDLAQQHGVSGIPDVRIFKGGKQVDQLVGLSRKEKYAESLDSLLQTP